ncbi:FecCD family ABC transporter permease [Microlunatus parietis]|uniref:Iron complex transport system permease protein n=1 Tax=Microlunatus parietis TaxID=682979 RepID=A0A7Y9LCL7_9ACTN|nr:iron ABC transporter permease [Microlunatus parietis]NYE71056.1 iron complex transport system permease protein [Microlunatus parietis]
MDAGVARAAVTRQHRIVTVRYLVLFVALAVAGAGLILASLAWGSVSIPIGEVFTILAGGEPSRRTWSGIVTTLRLPRTITAVIAGAAIGLAGLTMQTMFRNALADPYVLGVSSGASLGVGLVILPQGANAGLSAAVLSAVGPLQSLGVVGAAALGALAVLLIMSAIAARVQNLVIVLVAGIMLSAFITALVNVLVYFARPEAVKAFTSWQFGTFSGLRMEQLPVLGVVVAAGITVLALSTKQLNVSLLGEHYAQSMGMSVRAMRVATLTSTALLAGSVTAFAGPIAFLGIAAPHLARGLFRTTDHRILLPATAAIGILIAVAAGIFAQLPGLESDAILPLNAALALIGAPIVMRVLLRIHRSQDGFSL